MNGGDDGARTRDLRRDRPNVTVLSSGFFSITWLQQFAAFPSDHQCPKSIPSGAGNPTVSNHSLRFRSTTLSLKPNGLLGYSTEWVFGWPDPGDAIGAVSKASGSRSQSPFPTLKEP